MRFSWDTWKRVLAKAWTWTGIQTFDSLVATTADINGGTTDNVLQGNVKFDHNVETLAAHKTLVVTDKVIQKLDPDGTDRNVLLPAEGDSTDLVFFIYNMGGELGEDIYLQDDAGTALVTIAFEQYALCTCDGTTWKVAVTCCNGAPTTLDCRVKEENTSALVIGQPVYVSGATGAAFPNVGKADCDDSTKIRVIGLASEAISQNSTGYIRVKGLLEKINSTKGNTINPNSEDWTAGDQLWVARTAGGITNVRPTSGRNIKVGTALTVEGANSKICINVRENEVWSTAAAGEDVILRVGDEAGANKVSIRDYANNEVASFDSDGNLIIADNGLAGAKVVAASDTTEGVVERGTSAEVETGTDTTRYAALDDLADYYSQKQLALDVRDFIHDDGSGTNNVISTMAYIPKFITSGWPQAALNGLEVGGFWMDVYKNSHPAATSIARGTAAPDTPGAMAATSRSGVTVWDDISWISARIAASNRVINGRACHLVTPFERFAVMSWIMKSGNWGNVRGNNDDGKDTRDADSWENYGIFDPLQAEYRTLAGSGPASWWSGGVIGQGIHGLVGNVYEWEDCRIESGAIQPKAYLAGAIAQNGTYIDYDDNAGGDAADISQLTPGIYTITDGVNGNEDVTVTHVLITGRFTGRLILSSGITNVAGHGDNCLIQLTTAINLCAAEGIAWVAIGKLLEDATGKYMALPDKGDITTHAATLLDSWYKYDNSDSRALRRAGGWTNTTRARTGLFVSAYNTPAYTNSGFGFRSALSVGSL